MTPSDEQELYQLLKTGYEHPGPAAVRYPRGSGSCTDVDERLPALPLGRGEIKRQGQRAALLNFGPLLPQAQQVAETLDLTLVDMRFVKPLDNALIDQLASAHELLVTLEDHATAGGAGSAVLEHLSGKAEEIRVLTLGVPDRWIDHASREEQLSECGLDAPGIEHAVRSALNRHTQTS